MPKYEPLRYTAGRKKGQIVYCMHRMCWRPAVRIMGGGSPKHPEFGSQTHDCCQVHSRPYKEKKGET